MTVPTDVGNLELDAGKGNGKGKYKDSTGGGSKSKTAKVIKETAEEHTTFAYMKTTSSVARRSNSVIFYCLDKDANTLTTSNGIAATKLVTVTTS